MKYLRLTGITLGTLVIMISGYFLFRFFSKKDSSTKTATLTPHAGPVARPAETPVAETPVAKPQAQTASEKEEKTIKKDAAPEKKAPTKKRASKNTGKKPKDVSFRHPKKISKTWDTKALNKVEKWLNAYLSKMSPGETGKVNQVSNATTKVARIHESGNSRPVRYLFWKMHEQFIIELKNDREFIIPKK